MPSIPAFPTRVHGPADPAALAAAIAAALAVSCLFAIALVAWPQPSAPGDSPPAAQESPAARSFDGSLAQPSERPPARTRSRWM